ncbi:DUF5689 domain-containing protein [Pedobacter frigoris]|uniref:BACON domain-containing protein n=1 Tax=Pedobacter frigoris TaxID=2571272 RepID=A0A4V5NYY4_9SPHI|nr:DUF5689 domain-containing protein [Pedobacter frigoris]TKC06063.1 hypothetical protein FA047_12070 [Pedobacter frigoris]
MTLCVSVALLTLWGCKKQNLIEFSADLALNANIVRLADSAASTRIQVFADDRWELSAENNDWVKLDKTGGSGKSEFLATVTANKGQLPRAVKIFVKAGAKVDTVLLQQRGLTPTLNLVDVNMNAIAANSKMKSLLSTNVPFEKITKEVVFRTTGQENWVSNVTYDGTYLFVNVASSASSIARQAVLRLSYLDALGTTVKDSIIITQSPRAGYDNAVLKDFSYIKSLPAGVVNEDVYLEGVVLVDKGNPNVTLNPNAASNKHIIDKTESTITVYVQSLDGKSGLKLKMKTAGDHIFSKNERIKLWLKNTTIVKTTSPNTTTISDVPSLNVMEKVEQTTPLVVRELYMKDVVDDDVYTYVKLKDVEISISAGSYYNINEGYEFRVDTYPTNIRDINGNSMYMMLNSAVPYRRNGVQVPQGSGTISGVLVHETNARYGGNIGKYGIRPMAQSDIELKADRSQGFSNVLVEWDRFRAELQTGATAASNPLTPSIGTGKLSHTDFADLNYTTASGIYATTDYNGLIPESTTVKGAIINGGIATRGLWNTTKNRGGGVVIQVSTANITKPLSLQIDGVMAAGAPREWTIEWSNQGNMDAGTWQAVADFTLQDIVNFTSTLLTQVPGFKVINVNLPTATLGLSNLYIRIKAKNRNVGSATSDVGGTFSTAAPIHFGHISLKYNK